MPNGKIKYNVKYQGIRKTFYGDTEREVKDKYRRFIIEVSNGLDIIRITVSEAIEKWLTTVKQMTLKQASYDRLERTYELYVKQEIGNIQLNKITTVQCQSVINKHMMSMSYSSVKKIFELMKSCFSYYVKTGDIKKNPMDLVVMPRESLFEKKTKQIVIPSVDEMEQLYEVAGYKLPNGTPLYTKAYVEAVRILANTGIRTGELLALTEDKVSYENATIRIDRSISEVKNRNAAENEPKMKRIVTEPKTKNGVRTITVNSITINALKGLKEYYKERKFESEYFILNNKGKPASIHDIERTLRTICQAAGIKPFGPHTLRHYFASRCIANGVDVLALSKHLGHSSVSITLNTYAHLLDSQKDAFKNVLEML
jgi:integrase